MVKAIYSPYVFRIAFGGDLGTREYLLDHMSSYILGLAMVAIKEGSCTLKRKTLFLISCILLPFAAFAIPFIINDRRTSMLALAIVVVCFPFIISREKLRQLMLPIMTTISILGVTTTGVVGYGITTQLSICSKHQGLSYLPLQIRVLAIEPLKITIYSKGYVLPLFLGWDLGRAFPFL